MSAKEYCEICKRYHAPGLCPAERVMKLLTGSNAALADALVERDQRINEAVRWIRDTSLGTPEERANKAAEILKGIPPSENKDA